MPNDKKFRPATLDHLDKKKPLERRVPVVLEDGPPEALAAAEARLEEAQAEFDTWLSDRRQVQMRVVATMTPEERKEFLVELPDPSGAEDRRAALSAAKEAVEGAKEALEEATVWITFRALGRKRYEKLVSEYPPSEAQVAEVLADPNSGGTPPAYDPDMFPPALVAASAVKPELTLAQVQEIWEDWNASEISELFTAALIVNTYRRRSLGNG